MREVKLALLEADVNFKVVKKFISNVKDKCVGEEVLNSLTPGQQVIKIVNDELTTLMGETESKLKYSNNYGWKTCIALKKEKQKAITCGL